ncbi:integrin beta-1-like [Rhopilema esculentum]|uniref:integrin beta-1-like n=1 Tax=Rhopilema esculentum TaxID=499914 RepID=UPI0031D9EAB2
MAFQVLHLSILILGSVLLFSCIHGQESVFDCTQQTSCQKCIQKGPRCAWCKDEIYRKGDRSYFPRCDFLENHKQRGCKSISDPTSNYTLNKGNVGLGGENRVFPQNITLYLRPGRPATVNVRVKTPADFPVDLYYLMDLTYTMKDDLSQITNLGDLLSIQLRNVTSNFRLGFGGFVDKNLGPFTLTLEKEIKSRELQGLQQTFGFRNYLPLDLNTSKFRDVVKKTKISYNVDAPEGSLDALMQVVACDKEIGWRDKKKARRIVIVTTDGSFHYAGDGLLGGVAMPNDGKCHMSKGDYIASSTMDYPSLSFLREQMLEAEIVPIFATTGNLELFMRVQDFFGKASGAVAARLASNSANIVPLVREAYEKISRTVKVSTQKVNGINVKLKAKCGENKPWENKEGCTGVEFGEEVQFNVSMEASECSKQLKEVRGFRIRTSFDDVFVNLKLVCNCECDDPIYDVKDSPICNNKGSLKCGQCACEPTYKGRFCQCNQTTNEDDTQCRINGKVCSDRGICECGECVQCFTSPNAGEHIYGAFCECSNATCPKSFGQICGGKERGSCECNKCVCKSNWTGPTCGDECINSTAGCIYNNKICNNKGSCICGRCSACETGYFGDYCEQCAENCPDPCVDYKECVRCKVFKTSELGAPECETECRKRNITKITTVDYVQAGAGERCVAADKDDCSFVFTYRKDNVTEEIELLVQKERICPAEPDILAIILGVIAGIVGVGLALLLIWKLLATLKDRRELARFNKDLKEVKFDTGENPLYKQATSHFKNPMYEGTS